MKRLMRRSGFYNPFQSSPILPTSPCLWFPNHVSMCLLVYIVAFIRLPPKDRLQLRDYFRVAKYKITAKRFK